MRKFEIIIGKGYDIETFVYVFQGSDECKFGITNNINRRIKHYELKRPNLKLKYCKTFEDRNTVRLIEYKMKIHFNIISGLETTDAPINEVIEFIESSKTKLESLILELPEDLIEKNLAFEYLLTNSQHKKSIKDNKEKKIFSIAEKREINPNAYSKWEKIDDEKLELLHCEGLTIKELSEIFKRNNGAIRSRIKKLELKEKYGS